MISTMDFTASMGFLAEMLPMQRTLTQEALAMSWETMPNAAKIHLTPESLSFAVKQRLLDPAPPKDVALHIGLLRYVFPIERTTKRDRGEEISADRVILENGPKQDLPQRMADPDRFHDPAPARQEYQQAKRLPASGFWHPSQLTPEQRRAHVERLGVEVEAVLEGPEDGQQWTALQLQQGWWWFKKAVEGYWPLKADGGGIARAWVLRSPTAARDMISTALEVDAPPASEPQGDGVDDFLAGAW